MVSDDADVTEQEGQIIEGPPKDELLTAILEQQSVIFSIFLFGSLWEIIVRIDEFSGHSEQEAGTVHEMPWALSGDIIAIDPPTDWKRFNATYRPDDPDESGSLGIIRIATE